MVLIKVFIGGDKSATSERAVNADAVSKVCPVLFAITTNTTNVARGDRVPVLFAVPVD